MKKLIFCVTNDLVFDQRMARICGSLEASGYSVTLVGRKINPSSTLPQKPYRQVLLSSFFKTGKLMYLEYNVRLFIFLLQQNTDAITAIDLDTIVPVCLASILRKTCRAYDAHELFTEMKEVITRPSVHRAWLHIEQWAVPKFKAGYTVSQAIAKELNNRYGVQYSVIMNTPLWNGKMPEKLGVGKYLLYQGAVNEGRGLEWLIPAMKNVDMLLWVCGEGNYSTKCRQLIAEHGLQDKVLMKGLKTPDELRQITAGAYAGINLVEPIGLNQIYSLANKFFDYIHAGIPQVTMDFPEYRRINNEFEIAILLPGLSVEIVTDALNNLLLNEVLHNRLINNCLAAAVEYNWQHEEKKLKAFYNNIFA